MPETPDFTGMQGYLRDSAARHPRRLLAQGAAGARRGRADRRPRVLLDGRARGPAARPVADLGKTQFPQYTGFADEHGTAVFGEMVGKDNGYGVTGGVPDASMHGISPTMRAAAARHDLQHGGGADLRRAVPLARRRRPGRAADARPAGGTAYVPIEWTQANFDAIKTLEPRDHRHGDRRQRRPGPRRREHARPLRPRGARLRRDHRRRRLLDHPSALSFSSHGTRVDLQGWGQNITTTGSGGNLFGGTAPEMLTRRYTRSFSGTSGAGPIVVSAIVAVQSYLKATGQGVYTSAQMRDLLRRTGTPQTGTRHHRAAAERRGGAEGGRGRRPGRHRLVLAGRRQRLVPEPDDHPDRRRRLGRRRRRRQHRVPARRRRVDAVHGAVPGARPDAHMVEYRATRQEGQHRGSVDADFNVYDLDTPVDGGTGGSVPATLSLSLGGAASFGAFTPGVDRVVHRVRRPPT